MLDEQVNKKLAQIRKQAKTLLQGYVSDEWRDIPGYEGIYRVSDRGRVISSHWGYWHDLKPQFLKTGHSSVSLHKGDLGRHYGVHVLVFTAFIGPIPKGLVINHKDFNPRNNHYSNLEVVTQKENIAHSIKHRRHKIIHQSGELCPTSKLTWDDVTWIRTDNRTHRVIAKEYGVGHRIIGRIKTGEIWKSPGRRVFDIVGA